MTWGQLRLQLQTAAPGVSLDLLDEFLNTRYEQVLEAADWTGIKASGFLETAAAYQSATDTATLTAGQSGAVGVGTAWASGMVGLRFYRPGDQAVYTVTSVADAAHLVLDRGYEGLDSDAAGTLYAGSAYVLMQNVYQLPGDCESALEILDPETGLPLTRLSKAELDASAGPRATVGNPSIWALREDSSEQTPPVIHQVELYPPPQYARGLALTYVKGTYGFDGQNTGAAPMPWVSTSVLLYGCRADIAVYLEKAGQAKMYEAKFDEELARLLRLEFGQRRKKTAFVMASRFTRHRMARGNRGAGGWRGGTPGGPD